MEYIFGTVRKNGWLCQRLITKGDKHSNLSGYVTVVRKYADTEISDSFKVLEHYKTTEDSQGSCYDFYLIEEHYRNEDKFGPVSEKLYTNLKDVDALAVDHELRLILLELGVS